MIAERGQRFDTRAARAGRPRGRADVAVGLTTFEAMLMTPGAQQNEIARIDNDMRTFASEIATAAHTRGDTVPALAGPANFAEVVKAIAATPPAIAADPVVATYHAVWLPLWNTWQTFYAANRSGAWFSNPVSEAEKYQDQLIELRHKLAGLGVQILSPDPTQEHPEGMPSWLLPVGVGVGALVALSILARNG